MSTTPSRLERIAIARNNFVDRSQGDVSRLRGWIDEPASTGAMTTEDLRNIAHRLRGTAGSYGFSEVSTEAAALEAAVDACESAPVLRDRVSALIVALEAMKAESRP